MNYNIKVNYHKKVIHVVTTGDLILRHFVDVGVEIFLQARELGCVVLYDTRLSKNKISITDAYYLYSSYYDKADPGFRRIPVAYVVAVEDRNFYTFLECTCLLNGITIKIFHEENDVVKWLECL